MHIAPAIFLVLLSLLLQSVQATKRTNVCPILGPSFPSPSNLTSSKPFQDAVKKLDQQVTTAIRNGTISYNGVGPAIFQEQTFSIGLFSTHDKGLLWQRHHTGRDVATSPVGTDNVDADTVYRLGSVSKVLTMYILLMVDGDRNFNRPVTDFIPQFLGVQPKSPYGVLPEWNQITVGDLGTHLGGIVPNYGLFDRGYSPPRKGYPPLPQSRLATCNYQLGPNVVTCTKQELIHGAQVVPAIFAPGLTPSYSNLGYDLVGAVAENIAGVSMAELFKEKLVASLGLQRTFYGVPGNESYGAIPVDAAVSGWTQELGPANPDRGNTASTNDLATIGKSIMNSTILSPALTRRWLKPRTFTSDPTNFVGAPWEIYRWETETRLYDIYTKAGGEGTYTTLFVLVPDLDFGFTVLETGSGERAAVTEEITNMIAEAVLPAVEETARKEANQAYAGEYTNSQINSSVVITTDNQPGLKIVKWITNGTDIMSELTGPRADFRLWPNDLYHGNQVGFTATSAPPIQPFQARKNKPLHTGCQAWLNPGFSPYGDVAVGSFVFNLDSSSRVSQTLWLPSLNILLDKK